MERIKEAVEIAKANRNRLGEAAPAKLGRLERAPVQRRDADIASWGGRTVRLDRGHLRAMRIIADDVSDVRNRSFELLRTQVLQKMGESTHQTVGITSPTSGCGKTVCALNLAFSIARLPERSVTLVDFDLRKPQISSYLGLPPGLGIDALLNEEAGIDGVAVSPDIGVGNFRVLPTYRSNRNAAAHIASSKVAQMVQELRIQDPTGIIIFDLPPILVADDVISFLPQLDCVLLVVAAAQTTVSDIVNSERLLGTADVLGIILNKSEEGGEISYF